MGLRLVAVWVISLTMVTGCQSYHRRPLQLVDYARQWADRPLDVEPIQKLAETLANGTSPKPPFDSSDGLSLHEAEAVALYSNPVLRIARADAHVPLASAEQAGWWPDPQFEAEVLRFLNRGRRTQFRFAGPSLDGVNTAILGPGGFSSNGVESTRPGYRRTGGEFISDPMMVGASLSFTIPISGRLAVEKDVKWTEYSAAWREILVAEWELLTKLRGAWLAWSTVQQRVAVIRDYIDRVALIVDMAEQLARAGEMKPTDARVLRIELARQRAKLTTLEATGQQQRLKLFELMGIAPTDSISLQAQTIAPTITTFAKDRQRMLIDSHPRIKAVLAAYAAADQRLRLEIRMQYPDLQIGPSFSFEEGFSRLGLGFGFPIPLWNRNRQGVAEAVAEREAARIRAEAEVETILSQLAQVESRVESARQWRDYLIEAVAPLVDKQVEDSRTLLDLGEVDVLLLRNALSDSLETKLELLDATLEQASATNILEQMLQPRWVTPPNEGYKDAG